MTDKMFATDCLIVFPVFLVQFCVELETMTPEPKQWCRNVFTLGSFGCREPPTAFSQSAIQENLNSDVIFSPQVFQIL